MSFSDALRLRNATFCSSTLEGSCVFVTVEEARGVSQDFTPSLNIVRQQSLVDRLYRIDMKALPYTTCVPEQCVSRQPVSFPPIVSEAAHMVQSHISIS